MKNPHCDSKYCLEAYGEVRAIPSNPKPLHLCRTCWHHEMRKRRNLNAETPQAKPLVLHEWDSLKIYTPGE